jgi:hypothetical protein
MTLSGFTITKVFQYARRDPIETGKNEAIEIVECDPLRRPT